MKLKSSLETSRYPILNEITKYAKDCIERKIPSGLSHKWACQRLLRDIKSDKWDWSELEAKRIVEWFALLRHSKGVLAGMPIILTDWQKFRICQLYGWRRKDNGLRRFTRSYTQVGRKNAKSQEEAGIALYEISYGATKNKEHYECYTVGVKRDQSKLVFEEAILMLRGSILQSKFICTRDKITHKKTGSFIKPLSKEDRKSGDGTNPAVYIVDEYHQHPTDEFYQVGAQGMNTKEGLLMIITTAGIDLTYPCYVQEYQYCKRILNPDLEDENDQYFVDICEMDEGDDISDKKNWFKANPIRMSYPKGVELIEQNYKEACGMPEKMPLFLTKSLNKWVMAKESGYMDLKKWNECIVDTIQIPLTGRKVYVGVDMSSKIDMTSVAFIFPIDLDGVRKYAVKVHSFAPNEEKILERQIKDRKPYISWFKRGFITSTESPVVDQRVVIDYVINACKSNNWEIECFAVDPNNATMFETTVSDMGYEVEEVYQSHKSLNDSTKGFRDEVYQGNVIVEDNPVLNFSISNAVIRVSNGFIKIDKDATEKKIDPVDAILCGFKLAMSYKEYDWNDWTM
ncbi:MAG: terminase TerL endonuclease subunit [Eubacterium aggregans]|uniref:terminase large subunit n=1 Tax=Eubacterium aggregans TaxID=81409 RepID=UPI002B20E4D8|nr:terminase TerL endonuclease subunit [Eubacterium aggregans]MEA5073086.1 terminase TerL endonuclease subunit [Eubacterium aggregans]